MVLLQQLKQDVKSIHSYYTSASYSKHLPHGGVSNNHFPYGNLISKPISKSEAKEFGAKKHSEAERRRRLRINGQYSALRAILPNLVKMDKASVLSEAIRHVRELQKTVKGLKAISQSHGECIFPNEADELKLRYVDGKLKATLSCDDKPGLMPDITRALKSVEGRVVRAEMMTVGGRTKCVLWVKGVNGDKGMQMLKRALNFVKDRPVLGGNSRKFRFYQ